MENRQDITSSQSKENTGLWVWIKSLFSKTTTNKNPSLRSATRARSYSFYESFLKQNAEKKRKDSDENVPEIKFIPTPPEAAATPENSPRPNDRTYQSYCKEIIKKSGKELDKFVQAATPSYYFNLIVPEVLGTAKWVLATDAFVITAMCESSFKVFIGLPLGKKPTKIDIISFAINGCVTLVEASLIGFGTGEFVKNNLDEWRDDERLKDWIALLDKKPYFIDLFGTIGYLLIQANQFISKKIVVRYFDHKEKNLFFEPENIDTNNINLRFAQDSYNYIISFSILAAILEHLKINEYEQVTKDPQMQLLLLVFSYTLQQTMSLFSTPNLRQHLLLPYTVEQGNIKTFIKCLTGNEEVADDEDDDFQPHRSANKQLILSAGLRGIGHITVCATTFLLGKAWCWIDDENCQNSSLAENLVSLSTIFGITMFGKTIWNYRGNLIAGAFNCCARIFHFRRSKYETLDDRFAPVSEASSGYKFT